MDYSQSHQPHQPHQPHQLHQPHNIQQFATHPNQVNPYAYQTEISGNNNDIASLMSHIHTLNNKLQIMDQNIINIQKQHKIDIQHLHQSMSNEIKLLTKKMDQNQQTNANEIKLLTKTIDQNQQTNDRITYLLQQKINALTQPQKQPQKPHKKPILIEQKPQKKPILIEQKQIHNDNNNDDNNEIKWWLTTQCKLPQYYSKFIQNGYNTLSDILNLTETDLQFIGINDSRQLKKIYKQIKLLNSPSKTKQQIKNIKIKNENNANLPKQKQETKATNKKDRKKTGGLRWQQVKNEKAKGSSNMFEPPPPKNNTSRKIKWGKKSQRKLFEKLPIEVQKGCQDLGIHTFNELQNKIISSLYEQYTDNLVVSAGGTGKTVAIILSAIYRLLETGEGAAHIVFVAVDSIHVLLIKDLCDNILKYYDGINIIEQIKGSRYSPAVTGKGKNIFICSPGKAVNMFEKSGKAMVKNSIVINIFDGDTLMIENLFTNKIQNMFQYVPDSASIDINIISNSCCGEMMMNLQLLLGDDRYVQQLCKHICYSYTNLQFWSVFTAKNKKNGRLIEILNGNVFGCGLIFCDVKHIGKGLVAVISDQYKCQLFDCDSIETGENIITQYNNGIIEYLIVYNYSPCCLLKLIKISKLRFILQYEMKDASRYLMRCSVGGYKNDSIKIYCVALMDERQTKIYNKVEQTCGVKLKQITPKKMNRIFTENQNDTKDENYENYEYNENYDENYYGQQQQQGGYNYQDYGNNNNNYNNEQGYVGQQDYRQQHGGQPQPQPQPQPQQAYLDYIGQPQQEPMVEGDEQKMRIEDAGDIIAKPKDKKIELIECINEYMNTGNMTKILNLNCSDFQVWGQIIVHWFRDRKETEIGYFINLIVELFRYKILNNKDDRFNDCVIKFLTIEMDLSLKKNENFIKYVGCLFANLCKKKHLIPNKCYTYFNKRYKEYSDENKETKKININKIIQASVDELKRIQASQKLINKINKLSVK